jgi:hypothetical protein
MMPEPHLTRRKDPHRTDCWQIYFGDVRVGTIAKSNSVPNAEPQWQWLCGFYPGSNPGEQRGGTEATFEKAREAFGVAWRIFSANRTEADYQAWRDQQRWTERKYRSIDRGERVGLR